MNEYTPSPQVRAWGTANGYNVDAHVDTFNDYLQNRSKKPYKNLDAAFRSCVRADWENIRFQMTKAGTYWPKKQETRQGYQAPPPVEITPEVRAKIEQARSILRR
jgi:hypothetical protein